MKNRTSSKNTTSRLFHRYVWLVDLIYRNKQITFEAINDRWSNSTLNENGKDLPLRTFHNHCAAIQHMFDIDIKCDKHNGYVYYIENVDDMKCGGVRNWLLNAFAINNLINESHKLKQRILFEEIPSGQIYLMPIIEAMRDNLTLEITYHSFWRDEEEPAKIQPYCIKVFRQRWYVAAFIPKIQQIRIYSLDRIKNLHTTGNKFKFPKNFNGEALFNDCFGVIINDGNKAEIVTIKVFGNQAKYIDTLPLHHSQAVIESTPDYTIFSYRIKPSFDFRQEILSHGDCVEVLEPKCFREEVQDAIAEMGKKYEKGEKDNILNER